MGGGGCASAIDALSKRHATAAPSLRGNCGRRLDDDAGAAPAGSARSDEGLLLLAQLAPFGLKRVTSATAGAKKQHTTADRIFDESCAPLAASRCGDPTLRCQIDRSNPWLRFD